MTKLMDFIWPMMNKSHKNNHIDIFFAEAEKICRLINLKQVNDLALALLELRSKGGRLFCLGVGGGAANASHATNDFRKLCAIETYCASDNVSELTARANDNGLDTIFSDWLNISRLSSKDAIMVFSVGGGAKGVSESIIDAVQFAKGRKSKVYGITGKKEGHTAKNADICIIVPNVNNTHVTPHTEAFQMVVLHALVSHPSLQVIPTKW